MSQRGSRTPNPGSGTEETRERQHEVPQARRPSKGPGEQEPQVSADTQWWGFHVYLNRQAVEIFYEGSEVFSELLEKALPEPLNLIAKAYIFSRQVWAKAVDQGTGLRFTSPWIAPGAMVPTAWDDGEEATASATPDVALDRVDLPGRGRLES
ncbi:hypothetical protein NOGI109294_20215 [Nocardiopsis gilva]|uniref:hypothetical protein n=1 Tax=Nocardiopsis gilva TaxID=280236 RepID=UPI00034B2549|nr:hypothetical protein [Nocardiopsis gilva]